MNQKWNKFSNAHLLKLPGTKSGNVTQSFLGFEGIWNCKFSNFMKRYWYYSSPINDSMSSRHVTGVHKRSASQPSNNIRKEDVAESKSSSKQSPDVASRQSLIKNRWIALVVIALAIYTLYTQMGPALSRLSSVYTDPATKITSEILLDSVGMCSLFLIY